MFKKKKPRTVQRSTCPFFYQVFPLWPLINMKFENFADLGVSCPMLNPFIIREKSIYTIHLYSMWRIGQMSDCERIAKVAHDKWTNMSDSLRSLRTNERISESLGFFLANCSFLFRSQKINNLLKKIRKNRFLHFFWSFFLKKQKIRSFLLSEVSESLRSLRTNEQPWAIC